MRSSEELAESGGRPSYATVYEKLVRELLHEAALDDRFLKGVVKRFRQGPVLLCSRSIGKWVNKKLRERGWTQQQLADRLGIDRSAVAYWVKGGNIHLANLAQVLLEFKCQWAELPIPARQEMAVHAYLAALSYTQERLHPTAGSRPLDPVRFWALFHLFSQPDWERAVRKKDPVLLHEEAGRIVKAVEGSLGRPPGTVVDVASLKQLVSEWGAAWILTVGQVPRKWEVL
jgi:transcriptional regulator with XRE-family HTH domain